MAADQRLVLGSNAPPFAPPPGATAEIGWTATGLGPALLVALAGVPIVVSINLDLADDEVAIGGPDAGGTRRLFEGRDAGTGFNIIETVPVLIGAQALALGKAEDTAHVDGDVGVEALAVRLDTPATLAGTNGDYGPLQLDSAGNLRVAAVPGRLLGTSVAGPTPVPAASTLLAATDFSRKEITFVNSGPGPLYLRPDATAATTGDIPVPSGTARTFSGIVAQSEFRGISNPAGASVRVFSATTAV